MNRTRKAKILSQLFGGESAMLQQLKSQVACPLTAKDYDALTDQQLTAIFCSGGHLDPQKLTTRQLQVIIEMGTGKPCPDYDSMTDEELDAIIKAGTQTI